MLLESSALRSGPIDDTHLWINGYISSRGEQRDDHSDKPENADLCP